MNIDFYSKYIKYKNKYLTLKNNFELKGGASFNKFKSLDKACGKIISSNVTKFVEPDIDDDYVFDNINERQRKLVDLGDAYLILPGGYGTCSEMFEVMTKNDIGESSKPIFIFNLFQLF